MNSGKGTSMSWNSIKRIDSSEGNVCKFVYTKEDAVAESVLYKYPNYEDRTVICCSTMSGCNVGCRMCGAGDYFVRNLSSDEIVDQVAYSIDQTQISPRKMIWMSHFLSFRWISTPPSTCSTLSPILWVLLTAAK